MKGAFFFMSVVLVPKNYDVLEIGSVSFIRLTVAQSFGSS